MYNNQDDIIDCEAKVKFSNQSMISFRSTSYQSSDNGVVSPVYDILCIYILSEQW